MQGGYQFHTVQATPMNDRRIRDEALKAGVKVSAFVQTVFDIGMGALIGHQRGLPATTADLDLQVKLVLRVADQGDHAAIARATGVEESLVARILEGFRLVKLPEPRPAPTPIGVTAELQKPVPVPALAPAVAAIEAKPAEMNKGRLVRRSDEIGKLWKKGASMREIADAVGSTPRSIEVFAHNHRDICPKRRVKP